jgi:hypothetical protein
MDYLLEYGVYRDKEKKLTQIENVKFQSLPAFGGARGDQGSNAKGNPNVK